MDKKISQLTGATTPLTGTEELAIVQGGSTVKATAQDVADLAGAPYLVYTALLTQSGTDAPVATVLQNTTGLTVTWTRTNTGLYKTNTLGILASTNKVFCIIQSPSYTNLSTTTGIEVGLDYVSAGFPVDFFNISTRITGSLSDGILYNTPIEIRIYP